MLVVAIIIYWFIGATLYGIWQGAEFYDDL